MGYRATMKIHSSAGIIPAGEIVKKLPKKEIDFLIAGGAIKKLASDESENSLPDEDAQEQNHPAPQTQQELTELPITPNAEPVGGIGENGATDGNIGPSEGKNDQNK